MIRDLLERRVIQIVGVYLGAIFAMFEFTGLIVERYALSDNLIDMVLVGMLSFLPTVILIAYFHGKPGKDQWHRSEKIAIPLNVVVSAVLLGVLFRGEAVEAVAHKVEVTDLDGSQVVVEIPKEAYVRHLTLFFFEPTESTEKWLGYAIPDLIGTHLNRDPSVDADNPFNGYGQGFMWRLERAGFPDGFGVDIPTMQALARERRQDYFIHGEVSGTASDARITARIYRVDPFHLVAEQVVTGGDIFEESDELIDFIKQETDVQRGASGLIENFSVAELLTDSIPAYRSYIAGRAAMLFGNRYHEAIDHWLAAIEQDSRFLHAYTQAAYAYIQLGHTDTAMTMFRDAQPMMNKLPHRQRLAIQAQMEMIRENPERALAIYESWVEQYPNDVDARVSAGFANMYNFQNLEASAEHFERALEMDPQRDFLYQHIVNIFRATDQPDRAKHFIEEYIAQRPDEYEGWVTLGDIALTQGALDEAQTHYEAGALAENDMVTPELRLAKLALKRGDFDEMRLHFQNAAFIAQAPIQEATIHAERAFVHRTLGQPSQALAALEDWHAITAQYRQSLDTYFMLFMEFDLYVLAGEADKAKAILQDVDSQLEAGGFGFVADHGRMILAIAQNDPQVAQMAFERLNSAVRDRGRVDLFYLVEWAEGIIAALRDDHDLAIALFQKALATNSGSIQAVNDLESRPEILRALAQSLLKSGRRDEAILAAREALISWPADPDTNLILAQAYFEDNQKTSARDALKIALQAWSEAEPGYPPREAALQLAQKLEL